MIQSITELLGSDHKDATLPEIFCEKIDVGLLRYDGSSIPVTGHTHGYFCREHGVGMIVTETRFAMTLPEGQTQKQYVESLNTVWPKAFSDEQLRSKRAIVTDSPGAFCREAAHVGDEWYRMIEGVLNRLVENPMDVLAAAPAATTCNAQPEEKENF